MLPKQHRGIVTDACHSAVIKAIGSLSNHNKVFVRIALYTNPMLVKVIGLGIFLNERNL